MFYVPEILWDIPLSLLSDSVLKMYLLKTPAMQLREVAFGFCTAPADGVLLFTNDPFLFVCFGLFDRKLVGRRHMLGLRGLGSVWDDWTVGGYPTPFAGVDSHWCCIAPLVPNSREDTCLGERAGLSPLGLGEGN